jgi:hypothetical protein
MPKEHAKRVCILILQRNGNGNYLKTWRGDWFDAGLGDDADIEKAAEKSLHDAVKRKSSVLESVQTDYPHHD